ncbi:MAG TPA: phospholipase D-like domain-containing protein [Stenomitos sp.]
MPADRYVRSADRAALPSLPATTGNAAKLLVGGAEVTAEAVAMIQGAETLVQMDVFLLGGNSGHQVADAIIRKLQQSPGVKVQLMVDPGEGSLGQLHADMVATLARIQAAGAEVRTYPIKALRSNGNRFQNASQVDHDKLLDIDGRSMLIGGMNMCAAGEINRDYMVRIDGPAALQEHQVMNRDWSLAGAASTVTLPQAPAAGAAEVELTMTSGDRQDTKTRLLQAINDAKISINIGMYQLDDREVAQALIAAKRRGVAVQVLLSRNDKYAKYAPVIGNVLNGMPNQAVAADLKAAGVPVKWYVPRNADEELHAKYAVIDHELALVGSTNFTEKSFTIYRDSEAFIHSPSLAQDLEARMFAPDWQDQAAPVEDPTVIDKGRNALIKLLRNTKLAEW